MAYKTNLNRLIRWIFNFINFLLYIANAVPRNTTTWLLDKPKITVMLFLDDSHFINKAFLKGFAMGKSSGKKVRVPDPIPPAAPAPVPQETAQDVIESRDAMNKRLRLARGRRSTFLTRGMDLGAKDTQKKTLG